MSYPTWRAIITYWDKSKKRYLVRLADTQKEALKYAKTFSKDPNATFVVRSNYDILSALSMSSISPVARRYMIDAIRFADKDILGDDSTMQVATSLTVCGCSPDIETSSYGWHTKRQILKQIAKWRLIEDIDLLAIDFVNGKVYEKREDCLELNTL